MSKEQYGHAVLMHEKAVEELEIEGEQEKEGEAVGLEELKGGIEYQTEYLRVNGEELRKRVEGEIEYWSESENDRSTVEEIVNVFFSDEIEREFGWGEDVTQRSICTKRFM